jgi:hypothetical protein
MKNYFAGMLQLGLIIHLHRNSKGWYTDETQPHGARKDMSILVSLGLWNDCC